MKNEKQKFLIELHRVAKKRKFKLNYFGQIRCDDGLCPLAAIGKARSPDVEWENTMDFSARLGFSRGLVGSVVASADATYSYLSRSRRELRREMRKAVGL